MAKELYRVPNETVYDGMTINGKMMKTDLISQIRELDTTENDVLLMSYPRSGSHWALEIVHCILTNADAGMSKKPLMKKMIMIDMFLQDAHIDAVTLAKQQFGKPRILKSHLHARHIRRQINDSNANIIVVMRNPKDVLVSYYHFYRLSSYYGNFRGTFEEYFQLFDAKKLMFGDWLDHCKGYWALRDKPNVLIVWYEDMIDNLWSNVAKIAQFIGKPANKELVDRICKQVEFKTMQANPSYDISITSKPDGNNAFIRKGRAGVWRDVMTKAQSDYVDHVYGREIATLGLPVRYGPTAESVNDTEGLYTIPYEVVYDGMVINSKYITAPNIKGTDDLKTTEKDVIIAAYPRSGSTWLSVIVYSLLNDGQFDNTQTTSWTNRVFFLEFSHPKEKNTLDAAGEQYGNPRVMKTHLHARHLQNQIMNHKSKIIVIVRNPKDCLVSNYHFYRLNKFTYGEFTGTFGDFFKLFKANKLLYGDWLEYIKGYWLLQHMPNILIVSYEEVLQNLPQYVAKIGHFIGKPPSQKVIDHICDQVQFNKMKSNPAFVMQSKSDKTDNAFIRKGEVGSWRDVMTQAQSDYVDSVYAEEIARLGLPIRYEPKSRL